MDAQLAAQRQRLCDHLRLTLVAGVGPRIRQALLERFGDCGAVLAASDDALRRVPGVGPKLARRIGEAHQSIDVEAELALCQAHEIDLLLQGEARYPPLLAEIHDPPAVLFLQGALAPSDQLSIAIVGTRHATSYGRQQAERLASSLARAGLTIVSGLARGVDAAAHHGALEAGGRTLAILGSGLLNLYPPEHGPLAARVRASGAVVSESPPRFQPLAGSFPQRNRLISGWSLGVIVVEAAERSGALITARHAMEQGREVFAVPGRVDSRTSRGCHRLLRDGAKLVESADDVLEELGPLGTPAALEDGVEVRHPAELALNDLEQQVLQAIETTATPIDTLVATTGLPVSRILGALSVLEMRRLIRRLSGTQVARI